MASGARDELTVAIITASAFGDETAVSTESVARQPGDCAASFWARASWRSQVTVTLPGGSRFSLFWPTRPQPMRAMRGVFMTISFRDPRAQCDAGNRCLTSRVPRDAVEVAPTDPIGR